MGFAFVDSTIWGLEIQEENCICTEHAQIFVVVVISKQYTITTMYIEFIPY